MLNEEELRAVAGHGTMHGIGLCTCPCYDAIIKIGEAIKKERELMAQVGSVSPMALAALLGADLTNVPEDEA